MPNHVILKWLKYDVKIWILEVSLLYFTNLFIYLFNGLSYDKSETLINVIAQIQGDQSVVLLNMAPTLLKYNIKIFGII